MTSLQMLMETGWYGVSFAWYNNDPLSVEGILSYNFNEGITGTEIGSSLESILNRESIFNNQSGSVNVFYNFKESLLIPGKYYNEENSDKQLATVFGTCSDCINKTDIINYDFGIGNMQEIYNIYSIPQAVNDIISKKFPGAGIRHSTSMQLLHSGNTNLHCIVFYNSIKVILFSRSQLQFVQQFNYKTPEDVVYHLLNTCDKHDIAINDVVLFLNGMIDVQSNLYHELYKYFLNISFEPVSDEVFLSANIKAFPPHFFSHLTALAKCVS